MINVELLDVMKKREATRSYKNDKVDVDKINEILEACRLAPSAKNLQPTKLYVVQSAFGLEEVDKVSPCRYNAPVVIIVCSDKDIAWGSGNYTSYEVDASIACTHMMLRAVDLGLDTTWVRMFDPLEVKEQFNIPGNITPVALLMIGYKTDDYQGNPNHLIRKNIEDIVEYL